jgi:sugar lactone lactonase YvrE
LQLLQKQNYMKIKQTIFLLCLLLTGSLMAQTVKHFAGIENELEPNLHINNATCAKADAYFFNPEGICWDKNGNMWITEKNKIRLLYNNQFYNRAGNIGDPTQNAGYQNKAGIQSAFYAPAGIVADANGVLYIADEGNHAIRKMDAFTSTGQPQSVVTFAGANATGGTGETGTPGNSDGTGYSARFDSPKGIVRDASGNFYIADLNNSTIRKVSSTGVVTTLAGKAGVRGNVDATGANARFDSPYGIAILDANWLVVSDAWNGNIRKVHMSTGEVQTLAGISEDNDQVDGKLKNQSKFYSPKGLVVVDGKIYVCDRYAIRVIDINADKVSLFAGSYSASGNSDGEGSAARFGEVAGLAYNFNVNKTLLFVTDQTYNVIKTISINSLAPVVSFSANKTNAVVDVDVINFTNTSTGQAATGINWTITPSTYQISSGSLTSAPIGVKFIATGFYNVKLKITNQYGKDSLTKNNYISVSTVGIKEVPETVTVGVYPNPSNGQFTLQSLYGNYPIQAYEVIDITGKQVLVNACNNSLKETFDISHVQNGFYFVKVKTSSGLSTLKLQKI